MDTDLTLDDAIASARWLWRVPVAIGVVQVLFGIVVLVWPGITLAVVAVLIGLNLLVGGVLRLVMAMVDTRIEGRVLLALWSVLSVLAGIVVLRSPGRSVTIMVLVLGAFWVTWGLIEAVVALTPAARGARGPMLFEAGVAVAAGAVLLVWPEPTVTVLAWLAGLGLVLIGIIVFMTGWRLREAVDELEQAVATAP